MKRIALTVILLIIGTSLVHAQSTSLNHLYQLKDAKTRSISPENFTGEKGKGGMATLEEGSAARAARDLGQGWKVNPYVHIEAGTTFTLANIENAGIINHIWMTPVGDYRLMILRFFWDGETGASVEVPVGDFFAAGWGMGNEPRISSLAMCVNPRSGFNSYGYAERVVDGKSVFENFSSPYTGFYHVPHQGAQRRFGQYRWHITDPVRFESDLRITIQSLGWQSEGRYLPLKDDLASVAYWYQLEPHNPFPVLPTPERLIITNESPTTQSK